MIAAKDEVQRDLQVLDEQEQLLQFAAFNADTAWELGSRLRNRLLDRSAAGSVEIDLAGHLLFACATTGAPPGQANWIRRKRNVVRLFARSTYAVGRRLDLEGTTLAARHGLGELDYVAHGGGFPILLRGTGMVGTVIFSGLPQRDDHNLVVDAVAELLRIDVPRLAALL